MLAPELLEEICSHIEDQPTLYNLTRVGSRALYQAATPFLYAEPIIDGTNFNAFVQAICPSVNAHIRTNGLAELVKALDMSRLVHNSTKSLTARILGRVKPNLEVFVAPQASFGINCLAALSKCTKLQVLDLSFVSESISISDLLRSTGSLPKLQILHLPRSSGQEKHNRPMKQVSWPTMLGKLYISGGLSDESVVALTALPQSVIFLSIGHCTRLSMLTIRPLLEMRGHQLQNLEIVAPITALQVTRGPLDNVLNWAPNLAYLRISVDFLTAGFVGAEHNDIVIDETTVVHYSLKTLYLHCFDPTQCEDLNVQHVLIAILHGILIGVRVLGIHQRLGWRDNYWHSHLSTINHALEEHARKAGRVTETPIEDFGIRFFGAR